MAARGTGSTTGPGSLIRGDRVVGALSARAEASAWRVVPDGRGRAREVRMAAEELVGAAGRDRRAVAPEVLELRAVRALRAGRS